MHNNDKKLILKFNSKLFEINLRNTETAKLIAASIPIKSKIQTWGEEIFFNTNLQVKIEDDARGPCTVWAACIFKKSDFDNIKSGDKISLDWK